MQLWGWRRWVGVAVLTVVALGGLPAPVRSSAEPRSVRIVQLRLAPLATYAGEVPAYAATGPAVTGLPLDPGSVGSQRYSALIEATEGEVLTSAGVAEGDVVYRYRTAFSGFAARLTDRQAEAVASDPHVLAVSDDERFELLVAERSGRQPEDSDDEPDEPDRTADEEPAKSDGRLGADGAAFLGLPDGLWKTLGGPDKAGEGVIVAVIDSGITPEHPSFAAAPDGPGGDDLYDGPEYPPPVIWHGSCQAGEQWAVTTCNNKLIGARYFVEGFGADRVSEEDFLSPRDADGHGSHTAATAAGNYGVDPVFAGGNDMGVPLVSGIAPRAHVAAYKACWLSPEDRERPGVTPQSCVGSDLLAAIDAAVADGVDVINYSIGAASSEVFGPTTRAFLAATDAGIFVSSAAGNDGPDPGSVGSPASVPWVTAVGASTLARSFRASVSARPAGNSDETPLTARGKSLSGRLPRTALVEAAAVAAPGAKPEDAELCMPGSLDPAGVKDKVVLCRRGTNPRVEKGTVVKDAGGRGMVLYNADPGENVVADPHFLPAVHISYADGEELRRMIATGTAVKVELSGGRAVAEVGDRLGAFSSRGPQTAVPDIPKPDLVAPGVDILAATTPTPVGPVPKGETFAVLTGTSMAAPHIAGVAALLTQKDPTRSPAALRSALMTTALPALMQADGRNPALPFDAGSGRVDPNRAADPGLVLEVGLGDYARYLEGRDPRIVEGDLPPLAPADLNLPAVSLGAMPGQGAATRTFTSVDGQRSSWTVAVEGLPGLIAGATPNSFDIAPGQSQAVTLAFEVDTAPLGAYTFGGLVLTNAATGRTLRLPLSVRPVQVAVPEAVEIVTDQPGGSRPLAVKSGYQGELSALGWGLAAETPAPGQTVGPGIGANRYEPSPGVNTFDVAVAPGTQVVAARVSNADPASPRGPDGKPVVDLDLFVIFDDEGDGFDPGDEEVAISADADADEAVALVSPRPGSYRFSVVGYKTQDPTSTYDFTSWIVSDPAPDEGAVPAGAPGVGVTGDPVPVSRGGDATVAVEWAGLGGDGTYFGLITWHDGAVPDPARPVALTVVRVVKAPAGSSPAPWPDGRSTPPLPGSPPSGPD